MYNNIAVGFQNKYKSDASGVKDKNGLFAESNVKTENYPFFKGINKLLLIIFVGNSSLLLFKTEQNDLNNYLRKQNSRQPAKQHIYFFGSYSDMCGYCSWL